MRARVTDKRMTQEVAMLTGLPFTWGGAMFAFRFRNAGRTLESMRLDVSGGWEDEYPVEDIVSVLKQVFASEKVLIVEIEGDTDGIQE